MEQNPQNNICPICQKENQCDVHAQQCWCMTFTIPKALIDNLPTEIKGKQCICNQCIVKYNNSSRKR
uniref:cysteine-rich CWC family protein n=1 Tax=Solibacillus sp. FSL K6-1781 TaxID=2921474 RepID=UPI00406D4CBE